MNLSLPSATTTKPKNGAKKMAIRIAGSGRARWITRIVNGQTRIYCEGGNVEEDDRDQKTTEQQGTNDDSTTLQIAFNDEEVRHLFCVCQELNHVFLHYTSD